MTQSVPGKDSQHSASLPCGPTTALLQAAPEMLLGARCTEKADIYSFGRQQWGLPQAYPAAAFAFAAFAGVAASGHCTLPASLTA